VNYVPVHINIAQFGTIYHLTTAQGNELRQQIHEGSAEARDDPFLLLFKQLFSDLEDLLACQQCIAQQAGNSREAKLWIWTVNLVLSSWMIHICNDSIIPAGNPIFLTTSVEPNDPDCTLPWKQKIALGWLGRMGHW